MSESNSTPNSVQYKSLEFMGFPAYRVGNDGSVWSLYCKAGSDGHASVVGTTWKRLHPGGKGYSVACLFSKGVRHYEKVCRLVLMAFVGPCPEGMEACHFPDNDKRNDKLSNLQWGTRKENNQHRVIHKTSAGERNSSSVLTNEDVLKIRSMWTEERGQINRMAIQYQVNWSTIERIVKRKKWKHI